MSAVFGSLRDLKPSQRVRVERLALKRIPANRVITHETARRLTELSREVGRQLGILIDRKGNVRKVLVGDHRGILIPKLDGWRVGVGRLRGLRLVHTHLKDEALSREDLTDLALLRLDLIASIGVDTDGLPTVVRIAHLLPENPSGAIWQLLDALPPSLLDLDFTDFIRSLEEEMTRSSGALSVGNSKERAYLVGRVIGKQWEIEESLEELIQLADSCGVEIVGTAVQSKAAVDPRFVVGKGKLQEIVIDALHKGAGMLVFDTELSPAQVKAIGDFTELKVIDRSQLILDIFAQRAKSREGKIQVELAQLKYALPRLAEKDDALSRLTGGIGGRGPGETRLEVDRRRIHSRIVFLEKQIEQLARRRFLRRRLRNRRGVPVISIVGYTNAGKSTLLNNLTKSEILAEDKLFATLDPTSRRLRFPKDTEVIVTDTVGFLQDLPETLVAAFAATLDELADADLLVHVIDCSNPAFGTQMKAVEKLLEKLDLERIPTIRVFNKKDLVPSETADNLCAAYNGVAVSAIDPGTFPPLIKRMEDDILMTLSESSDSDRDQQAELQPGMS
ncbi:MAG TPA: GTPase HflX [Desulfomonilaceae bacterium]|nr:GTPase HflX [Desulfomonilaceae bacterium]